MIVNNNFINFSGFFIGKVMELDRKYRMSSVHIPKLMPMIPDSDLIRYDNFTELDSGYEKLNISQNVKVVNGIWGKPENSEICLPAVGSKVLCFFLEDDPKQMFFRPFNINDDYEDDEEDIKNGYVRQTR